MNGLATLEWPNMGRFGAGAGSMSPLRGGDDALWVNWCELTVPIRTVAMFSTTTVGPPIMR